MPSPVPISTVSPVVLSVMFVFLVHGSSATLVGAGVGSIVGELVGLALGEALGDDVGAAVGLGVGAAVLPLP